MGHVRSNSELVSKLSVFAAKRSKDYPSWLVVTCPHDDCGETFLVRASTWFKPHKYKRMSGEEVTITGRSCPYCFKAGRLPSRRTIR